MKPRWRERDECAALIGQRTIFSHLTASIWTLQDSNFNLNAVRWSGSERSVFCCWWWGSAGNSALPSGFHFSAGTEYVRLKWVTAGITKHWAGFKLTINTVMETKSSHTHMNFPLLNWLYGFLPWEEFRSAVNGGRELERQQNRNESKMFLRFITRDISIQFSVHVTLRTFSQRSPSNKNIIMNVVTFTQRCGNVLCYISRVIY